MVKKKNILYTERPLGKQTKVIRGFYYVIDQNEGLVVTSGITGTYNDLFKYLVSKGYVFKKIYWCDIKARNLI